MIMRAGGRFPYLQEPESVFAAQGKGGGRCVVVFVCVCVFVCVSSLVLSVCVRVYKQKELRYMMDP